MLKRVAVRVTTHGADGAVIAGAGEAEVTVPVVPARTIADPTGVGDAFRGGFLTAREWGLDWDRAAEVGSLLATMVLETVGTQEYVVKPAEFGDRLAESYGDDAAAEVLPFLPN